MKELEKKLGNKLFNFDDIEYVRNEVNKNIDCLFVQDLFLENKEKLYEIERKIEELKSSEINSLFKEYENLIEESIEYKNCLAYYIGLKNGMKLGTK